jgi:hypothetical protein
MTDPCALANPHFDTQLALLRAGREKMLALASALTEEQLLRIPAGFHNNILWNLGHVCVAQQSLCYKPSGLPLRIPSYVPGLFGKGTSPAQWTAKIDVAEVKSWLLEGVDLLQEDLGRHVFRTYEPYLTSMGIRLASISEALAYAVWHDGLHLGVMLAQRKLV